MCWEEKKSSNKSVFVCYRSLLGGKVTLKRTACVCVRARACVCARAGKPCHAECVCHLFLFSFKIKQVK